MQEIANRFIENVVGRVDGPMAFRFILQPVIAIFLAFRDGRKDAREGRPPYSWTLFTKRSSRSELLREGWRSVGKVFIVAILIDMVYQYIMIRWFYPNEALLVAFILAFIPYLLVRGTVNRLSFHIKERKDKESTR